MKKLIIFLATLFVFLTLSIIAEGQTAVRYHTKLQKEASYENRMKSNRGFSIGNARKALRDVKASAKEDRKKARDKAKREAVYARIEELKTKSK